MNAAPDSSNAQARATADARAAARTVIDAARAGAVAFSRPDLAELLVAALDRIDRTTTIVAVIGDYKQGKSSLVNALLREPAAVVGDDVATTVPTLFRYGKDWTATATTGRRLTLDEYRALVAAADPTSASESAVSVAVDVTLPAPLLSTGLSLLDVPSAGGLSTASSGLFTGLLRSVDGVLYVADASAPLDVPRLELLRQVMAACPAVLVVRTKIDLYGEWRRILDIDRAALTAAGLDVPMVAASSVLMEHATTTSDPALADASGIPTLRQLLDSVVMGESRENAVERAVADALFALEQLVGAARDELTALQDPSSTAPRRAQLEDWRRRLAHLRGAGARWSQALADTFGDAVGEADHHFRAAMRQIARELDERLEQIDPAREWPAFAAWLQERTAAASDELFDRLSEAAIQAETAARDVLREETDATLEGMAAMPRPIFDAERLARARGIEGPGLRGSAGLVFSALRGGQSGFFSLSFIAGIAGVTLSGVATAGLGLIFAGRQVLDDRRRQLQTRRQGARTAARRYLEDVEFVTAKQSRDTARNLLRSLREHFLDQFARLQQTCAESVATIEAALNLDVDQRARRVATLGDRIGRLEQLQAAATQLQSDD